MLYYYSPELVQNEAYDKKADIWAVGCILFEMAALAPAFKSTNMLTLAKKVQMILKHAICHNPINCNNNIQISEGDYDKSLIQDYSKMLHFVVDNCLCINPTKRPDSIQVHKFELSSQ